MAISVQKIGQFGFGQYLLYRGDIAMGGLKILTNPWLYTDDITAVFVFEYSVAGIGTQGDWYRTAPVAFSGRKMKNAEAWDDFYNLYPCVSLRNTVTDAFQQANNLGIYARDFPASVEQFSIYERSGLSGTCQLSVYAVPRAL